MNTVVLIGRMTKDPDVRANEKTTVARFTLAVDRKFKKDGEQSADFISCVAFGKTAELIERYFHKGMKMGAEGEWRTGSYTNKDGNKVYTTDVIIDTQEFCESKASNGGQAQQPTTDTDGFMSVPDGIEDELPFA